MTTTKSFIATAQAPIALPADIHLFEKKSQYILDVVTLITRIALWLKTPWSVCIAWEIEAINLPIT